MKNPHDIILRPVLTEKAYEGIDEKRYVFEVDIRANKAEIKSAIDNVRFEMANYHADTNAVTVATGQKILDKLGAMELAQKDATIGQMAQRINQLELREAMCGVVRYPMGTTYVSNCNPFNWGGNCNPCVNGAQNF